MLPVSYSFQPLSGHLPSRWPVVFGFGSAGPLVSLPNKASDGFNGGGQLLVNLHSYHFTLVIQVGRKYQCSCYG